MGTDLPVIKGAAIVGAGYVCGANRPDTHLIGVEPGRDFPYEEMDVRLVQAGDLAPGGHPIEIEPAIEVGQIFKLGARYSEPLGANYLDEDGTERPIMMGSYGIGPARTVAAAIEQRADERGIVWPPQKIGPGLLMRTVVFDTGSQIAVTPSSPNISTLPLLSSAMWTAVIALGGVNGVPQTPVSTLAALAREGACDANEAATTPSPAMIAMSGPRGSRAAELLDGLE